MNKQKQLGEFVAEVRQIKTTRESEGWVNPREIARLMYLSQDEVVERWVSELMDFIRAGNREKIGFEFTKEVCEKSQQVVSLWITVCEHSFVLDFEFAYDQDLQKDLYIKTKGYWVLHGFIGRGTVDPNTVFRFKLIDSRAGICRFNKGKNDFEEVSPEDFWRKTLTELLKRASKV